MIPKEIYPLLGAIIGGLIGYLSSRAQWKNQNRHARKNLAKALLLEIRQVKSLLKLYVDVFEKTPGAYAIQSPFYGRDGLYYAIQKDIAIFDIDLASELYAFYMKILEAERARQVPKEDQFFQVAVTAVRSSVFDAYRLIPSIESKLESEIA